MGILIIVATALGGLLSAICIGLLKDEAAAWLPSLNRVILAAAARRVPEALRDRYTEEWAAHVLEYPGKLSQFIQSLRCFFAGAAMEDLSARSIDRMISLFVISAGVGMHFGLLLEKYRDVNFIIHHVLGFIDFSSEVLVLWMAVWFIWRRRQVLRHLRGGIADPRLP